ANDRAVAGPHHLQRWLLRLDQLPEGHLERGGERPQRVEGWVGVPRLERRERGFGGAGPGEALSPANGTRAPRGRGPPPVPFSRGRGSVFEARLLVPLPACAPLECITMSRSLVP